MGNMHRFTAKPDIFHKKNIFICPICKREVHIYWGNVEPKIVIITEGEDVGHDGTTFGMKSIGTNTDLWKGLFNV